ncbi:hypothetical protein [Rubidibacter lacunae]
MRFYFTANLVQHLQQARTQIVLPGILSKLDSFDLLIVDDL